ncbi:MAG: DUF6164 family protein, partial [Lysobacterales bacterium]
MSKLLFNLRNVPDDEADEVRALLEQSSIRTYETRPSPFGVSSGAIWLKDLEQHETAKYLIDAYQVERAQRARGESEIARREGRIPSLVAAARAQPWATLLLLVAIAAVLAISAW